MRTIGIIGAGMSGMIAAIYAASSGSEVILFERQDRVGKKILLTGNGKCNLSNTTISKDLYHTDMPEALDEILSAFPQSEEETIFEQLGILTKVKNGGIYPVTNQASSVLDALRIKLKELSVEVVTDCFITRIEKKGKYYSIYAKNGKVVEHFDEIIISTGGLAGVYHESENNGNSLLASLGHKLIKGHPALVQALCDDKDLKMISGVRIDAKISLLIDQKVIDTEFGELQLTDKGLSGIAVFQLTRKMDCIWKNTTKLIVDFLVSIEENQIHTFTEQRAFQMKKRTVEEFFNGMLHKKLAAFFLRKAGIKSNTLVKDIKFSDLEQLILSMKKYPFFVYDLNGYANAQISTGGVSLKEVEISDLSSKYDRNIHITGEALNVAGACGGYNLHFAIACGYLVGKAIGEKNRK